MKRHQELSEGQRWPMAPPYLPPLPQSPPIDHRYPPHVPSHLMRYPRLHNDTATTMSERFSRVITSPARGVPDPVVLNAGFTFRLTEDRPVIRNHLKVDAAFTVPHTQSSNLSKKINQFLRKSVDRSIERDSPPSGRNSTNQSRLTPSSRFSSTPEGDLLGSPLRSRRFGLSSTDSSSLSLSPKPSRVFTPSSSSSQSASIAEKHREILSKVVANGALKKRRAKDEYSTSSSIDESGSDSDCPPAKPSRLYDRSQDTSDEIKKLEDLSSGSEDDDDFYDMHSIPSYFCIPGRPQLGFHDPYGGGLTVAPGRPFIVGPPPPIRPSVAHSFSLPAVNKLKHSTAMGNIQGSPQLKGRKKYPAPAPPPISREGSFVSVASESKQPQRSLSFKKYPAPLPPTTQEGDFKTSSLPRDASRRSLFCEPTSSYVANGVTNCSTSQDSSGNVSSQKEETKFELGQRSKTDLVVDKMIGSSTTKETIKHTSNTNPFLSETDLTNDREKENLASKTVLNTTKETKNSKETKDSLNIFAKKKLSNGLTVEDSSKKGDPPEKLKVPSDDSDDMGRRKKWNKTSTKEEPKSSSSRRNSKEEEKNSRGSSRSSSRGVTPDPSGIKVGTVKSKSGKLAALANRFEEDKSREVNGKQPPKQITVPKSTKTPSSLVTGIASRFGGDASYKKEPKLPTQYYKPFEPQSNIQESKKSIGGIPVSSKFGEIVKPTNFIKKTRETKESNVPVEVKESTELKEGKSSKKENEETTTKKKKKKKEEVNTTKEIPKNESELVLPTVSDSNKSSNIASDSKDSDLKNSKPKNSSDIKTKKEATDTKDVITSKSNPVKENLEVSDKSSKTPENKESNASGEIPTKDSLKIKKVSKPSQSITKSTDKNINVNESKVEDGQANESSIKEQKSAAPINENINSSFKKSKFENKLKNSLETEIKTVKEIKSIETNVDSKTKLSSLKSMKEKESLTQPTALKVIEKSTVTNTELKENKMPTESTKENLNKSVKPKEKKELKISSETKTNEEKILKPRDAEASIEPVKDLSKTQIDFTTKVTKIKKDKLLQFPKETQSAVLEFPNSQITKEETKSIANDKVSIITNECPNIQTNKQDPKAVTKESKTQIDKDTICKDKTNNQILVAEDVTSNTIPVVSNETSKPSVKEEMSNNAVIDSVSVITQDEIKSNLKDQVLQVSKDDSINIIPSLSSKEELKPVTKHNTEKDQVNKHKNDAVSQSTKNDSIIITKDEISKDNKIVTKNPVLITKESMPIVKDQTSNVDSINIKDPGLLIPSEEPKPIAKDQVLNEGSKVSVLAETVKKDTIVNDQILQLSKENTQNIVPHISKEEPKLLIIDQMPQAVKESNVVSKDIDTLIDDSKKYTKIINESDIGIETSNVITNKTNSKMTIEITDVITVNPLIQEQKIDTKTSVSQIKSDDAKPLTINPTLQSVAYSNVIAKETETLSDSNVIKPMSSLNVSLTATDSSKEPNQKTNSNLTVENLNLIDLSKGKESNTVINKASNELQNQESLLSTMKENNVSTIKEAQLVCEKANDIVMTVLPQIVNNEKNEEIVNIDKVNKPLELNLIESVVSEDTSSFAVKLNSSLETTDLPVQQELKSEETELLVDLEHGVVHEKLEIPITITRSSTEQQIKSALSDKSMYLPTKLSKEIKSLRHVDSVVFGHGSITTTPNLISMSFNKNLKTSVTIAPTVTTTTSSSSQKLSSKETPSSKLSESPEDSALFPSSLLHGMVKTLKTSFSKVMMNSSSNIPSSAIQEVQPSPVIVSIKPVEVVSQNTVVSTTPPADVKIVSVVEPLSATKETEVLSHSKSVEELDRDKTPTPESFQRKVRKPRVIKIPDEVLNVSDIVKDAENRLNIALQKNPLRIKNSDGKEDIFLDAFDPSQFDTLMPLPACEDIRRSRSSTPFLEGVDRATTPSRAMQQTESILSETDRILRTSRSHHSLRRSFTRSLSGISINRLAEVSADLNEEHSTSHLAGERIEAEQAERMRLEKEISELQNDVKQMTSTNGRLERERSVMRSEMLHHADLNGDLNDSEGDASLYKRKYEWSIREMDVLKRQLKQQQEDYSDQLYTLKKQLEKKVSDAYEESDEQRQIVAQLKKKSQRLQAEMNDMKILFEEQTSRNNLLEKKQRKFDQDMQGVQEEHRNERLNKDKIQREKDQILSEKYSYEQEVSTLKLELDLKEEKISSLTKELNDLNFTGKAEEEVALLKKAKHDLELRVKDQEEELDDLAGQVQMLESAKLRLEMSIESMRKENRKESQLRDEEVEEIRIGAQKKIKGLESQLECEHEERTQLVREKHDLERRLADAHDRNFATVDEDSFHKVRKELKKTKALLKDTQTMLDKTQQEGSNKLLLRQLKTQLEDVEFAKTAALKARQSSEAELNEIQMQMDEISRSKKDAEEKCLRLTKDKTEMQTQLEESEEEVAEVMKKYKASVAQLSLDQCNISEQSQFIAELEHEKQVLQDRLSEMTNKVEVLEGETANIHTQRRLQMKIKELESKLDLEITTKSRLESQISRLKDQVEKLCGEMETLRQKESQAAEHSKRLNRQLREVKEDSSNLLQKNTDAVARRQDLEKQQELAESEIITLKSDLKLAFKRIEDLQQALQGDLSDSDTELTDSDSDSDTSLSSLLASVRDSRPKATRETSPPCADSKDEALMCSPSAKMMSSIQEDDEYDDFKESFA